MKKIQIQLQVSVALPGLGTDKCMCFETTLEIAPQYLSAYQCGHEVCLSVSDVDSYISCLITKPQSIFREDNSQDPDEPAVVFHSVGTIGDNRLSTEQGCKQFFVALKKAENIQLSSYPSAMAD